MDLSMDGEDSEDLWPQPAYTRRVRKYRKLLKKKKVLIKLQTFIRKVVPKLKACIKIQTWIRKMNSK